MADSKAQQEPSIEEILSSIRQIINEDGDDAPSSPGGAPAKPSALSGNDDDVLDLAALAKPGLPSRPVAAAADDLSFEDASPLSKPEPVAMAPVAPAPPVKKDDTIGESLMSEGALNAAAASLTKLAQAEVMIDHKHAAGIGSVTLEDVVKEMLRPMMKSWLDDNLPPLVERLVQKEIQKMSSRA